MCPFKKDNCPFIKDNLSSLRTEASAPPHSRPTRLPVVLRTPTNYPRLLNYRVARSLAPGHACRAAQTGDERSVCHAVAVADHFSAPRGRFSIILGSMNS